MAEANNLDPVVMLGSPRQLHTIEVQNLAILDLRTEEALAYVGLTVEDISDDDWAACQSVGHAAYFLNVGAVVAPSATGRGLVIATFETRVGPGQLTVTSKVDFTEATYRRIAAQD